MRFQREGTAMSATKPYAQCVQVDGPKAEHYRGRKERLLGEGRNTEGVSRDLRLEKCVQVTQEDELWV
jgi:hypothetical protein